MKIITVTRKSGNMIIESGDQDDTLDVLKEHEVKNFDAAIVKRIKDKQPPTEQIQKDHETKITAPSEDPRPS